MVLAQKLYESGKITYMRTDSVNLSETAREDIEEPDHTAIREQLLPANEILRIKTKSAQEAHEAIRPTYMENATVENADCRRLYELIWKRTIACQMADAELEKTTAKILISTNKEELYASGEVLKFDGFLKAYREDRDEEEITEDEHEEGMFPPLSINQVLPLGNEGDRKIQQAIAKVYRSLPGEKTRRTGYWPAFNLCTNHFHHPKKRLCGKKG